MTSLLDNDAAINAAVECALAAASVLLLIAIIGWPQRFRPTCRRCAVDLRPVLWSVAASDGNASVIACTCGAALERAGAVRWRGWTPMRRLCVAAVALLGLAVGVRGWSLHRASQGLLWRDLVSAERLVRALESSVAPGSMIPAVVSWRELNRRFALGQLTDEQVTRVLRASQAIGQPPGMDTAYRAFMCRTLLEQPAEARSIAADAIFGAPRSAVRVLSPRTGDAGVARPLALDLVPPQHAWMAATDLVDGHDTMLRELLALTEIRLNGEVIWPSDDTQIDRSGQRHPVELQSRLTAHAPDRLVVRAQNAHWELVLRSVGPGSHVVELEFLAAAADQLAAIIFEDGEWTAADLLAWAEVLPTYRVSDRIAVVIPGPEASTP